MNVFRLSLTLHFLSCLVVQNIIIMTKHLEDGTRENKNSLILSVFKREIKQSDPEKYIVIIKGISKSYSIKIIL